MNAIDGALGRLAGLFLIALGCVAVLAVPDQINLLWLFAILACPVCVCVGLVLLVGRARDDPEED